MLAGRLWRGYSTFCAATILLMKMRNGGFGALKIQSRQSATHTNSVIAMWLSGRAASGGRSQMPERQKWGAQLPSSLGFHPLSLATNHTRADVELRQGPGALIHGRQAVPTCGVQLVCPPLANTKRLSPEPSKWRMKCPATDRCWQLISQPEVECARGLVYNVGTFSWSNHA